MTVELIVRIVATEPIEGTVGSDGQRVPFVGWTGLLQALADGVHQAPGSDSFADQQTSL